MQQKSRESHNAEAHQKAHTPSLMFQFADWIVPVQNINDNNQTFCENRARLFPVPELPHCDSPQGTEQIFSSKVKKYVILFWIILSIVLYSFRKLVSTKHQSLLILFVYSHTEK